MSAVLGIETSCDETSAALVRELKVESNVVASQVALHQRWGGIVPEMAARAHVEAILPVISEALGGVRPEAIAVTNRPGLVGALAVGVAAATGLSLAWDVPLVGVHHLEAHILSVLADDADVAFPHLCLLVSGGHTELVEVGGPGDYRVVARTLDDAAGEAFDKGARLLGLGYPGGRALEDLARSGDPGRYVLPRGVPRDPSAFSFSGLKTATLRLVEAEGDGLGRADAAASLQAAIVDALVAKVDTALATCDANTVTLCGGVAANAHLRERMAVTASRWGRPFVAARPDLCTDNAAMIAIAGAFLLASGVRAGDDLDCHSQSPLPSWSR